MKICPTCNGQGYQTVILSDFGGGEGESFKTTCVICNGEKKITEKRFRDFQRELEMWCHCDAPDMRNGTYHADGENPNCFKHNWTCGNCGKILQVG